MFDIARYYEAAKSGDIVDAGPLLEYVKGFDDVVLWGASYLGKAIGQYLIDHGVSIATYWDLRSEQIGEVYGIPVIQPFAGAFERQKTLVILCISNNMLKPVLSGTLEKENYHHLLGDYFYMGTVCPANKRDGIIPDVCMRSMCCRFIFCDRLCNIVNHANQQRQLKSAGDALFLFSITVVINSICSLSCKYCTSYMHSYPADKRKNFPLSRIVEDIDRFFAAVDGVGTVTVMGGEPFLHPEISAIVQAILEKPNCGVISISTSGTCRIRKEQLVGMKNDRVNISFSNYLGSLNEKKQQLFHENVKLVQAEGIPHTVGVDMPQWIVPSTLYDRQRSTDTLIAKKSSCVMPPRCVQLKNGKLHPCDFGSSVYNLGVADYPADYVDVAATTSIQDLRKKIGEFLNASYYKVCGHCECSGTLTSQAGEQGFHDSLQQSPR
jgi:organic radical activating enzyme